MGFIAFNSQSNVTCVIYYSHLILTLISYGTEYIITYIKLKFIASLFELKNLNEQPRF